MNHPLFDILQQVKAEATMKKMSSPALASSIVTGQETSLINVDLHINAVVANADISTPYDEREQAAKEHGTALAHQIGALVEEFKAKLNDLGVNIDVDFGGSVAASASVFKDAEMRAQFEADNASGLAAMREAGTLEA